jgi:hypothetical protein
MHLDELIWYFQHQVNLKFVFFISNKRLINLNNVDMLLYLAEMC